MLIDVVDPDSPESIKFWASAHAIQTLSNWGVAVSSWLHKCRCHHHKSERERDSCHLKGRCGIELAAGAWKDFLVELEKLKLTNRTAEYLRKLEHESAQKLMESFQNCKQEMLFRSQQAWSYWDQLPHNILALGYHFLTGSALDENDSRERAKNLLYAYDNCSDKSSLGIVSWYFFSKHRQDVLNWCIKGQGMTPCLTSLLMGYGTALIVMQRLEGRHHLINLRLSRGRALLPGGLQADTRRARHPDLQLAEFQQAFPSLLQNFSALVPEHSWQSRRELLRHVYGFGLEELHPDVTTEQELLDRSATAIGHGSSETSRMVSSLSFSMFLLNTGFCWPPLVQLDTDT